MVVTTFPLVSPLVLVLPVTMTRGRGVGEIGCSDSGSGSSGGSGGDGGGDGCEELVVSSEGVGVTSCIELLVVGTVVVAFSVFLQLLLTTFLRFDDIVVDDDEAICIWRGGECAEDVWKLYIITEVCGLCKPCV